MKKSIKLISFLLVLVIGIVPLSSCDTSRGSPEKVVEAMLTAYNDGDTDALLALLPKGYLDGLLKEDGVDEEEFRDGIEKEFDALDDLMDELRGKVRFTVEDKEELSKQELKALKKDMEKYLESEISDAATVSVKVKTACDYYNGDYDITELAEFVTVQIRGSWYILPDSLPKGPTFFLGATASPHGILAARMSVFESFDSKALMDLIPEEMWEPYLRDMGLDKAAYRENQQKVLDDMQADLTERLGEYTFSYQITDEFIMVAALEEVREELAPYLEGEIEEAVSFSAEGYFTYKAEDGMNRGYSLADREYIMFRYKGQWYLHPDELFF